MWGKVLRAVPGRRAAAYAVIIGAALVFPFRLGVVQGESMSPSLRNGQFYLLDRSSRRFRHGDVVVFRHGHATFVKRVLAIAGETVQLLSFGGQATDVAREWQVRRLSAPTFHRRTFAVRLKPFRVPAGHLYLVGDNLYGSEDSREFGPVPVEKVEGKVLFAPEPDWEWTRLVIGPRPSHS